MEVKKTRLDGVLLIKPPTVFEDFRGTYVELYNAKLYADAGITVPFIQDDISTSTKYVLRGIHGDQETWKMISCLYGSFYLVVVNWDEGSRQFKQWESFVLSDQNRLQVLIPPNSAMDIWFSASARYFITNSQPIITPPGNSHCTGMIPS